MDRASQQYLTLQGGRMSLEEFPQMFLNGCHLHPLKKHWNEV